VNKKIIKLIRKVAARTGQAGEKLRRQWLKTPRPEKAALRRAWVAALPDDHEAA